MWTHPCPHCGRPIPLSLSSPADVRCGACERSSTLPTAVLDRLAEGRALLATVQRSDRQLSRLARWLVRGGALWMAAYGLLIAGVVLILGGTTVLLAWIIWDVGETSALAGVLSGPLCVTVAAVGVGGVVVRRLGALRRRLREAAAVRPPGRPGEPGRCHVCAAPVAIERVGVVRCGHCEADNVVATDLLARVAAEEHAGLDTLEDQLRGEAVRVTLAASGSSVAGLGCLAASPVGCGLPVSAGLLFAASLVSVGATMSSEPHPGNRYVEVQTAEGRCLAWVNAYDEDALVLSPPMEVAGTGRTWTAEELIGGHFVDRQSGRSGRLDRMRGRAMVLREPSVRSVPGHDGAALEPDGGGRWIFTDTHSLCFD